ncbi:hypothetical protein GUITHDRAFT_109302 [Guillardia theta CCMP2712]|uniref:Uncharacterized protein n=1 Tax=Guillardia theta (strain CCMP2712) TaxID=905079 RepID=L1J9A1_GUITC|nr:hypothetical protein GUITHDRAFT_109302 [Guillardia theta CCMP2712]EKX44882.1 hypothetical protein GUITHDRAFT_109302 [Guillardia theta CCMP2712]|eukprot:XP_005831862.1 hypothetical protein GUITHDRAFT_109302 [Guillardia theta CCMP2712]
MPAAASSSQTRGSQDKHVGFKTLVRESKDAEKLLSASKQEAEKSRMQRDAIAQDLDERLVQDPNALQCKCNHAARWAIVKKAKQVLLKEEGAPDSADASEGCPCKSTLVQAVTKVLEQKLSLLEQQLGSRTSAELAMQRALVAMRLPKFLAGDLAKELDQKLAAKAKLSHASASEPDENEGEEDEEAKGSDVDVPEINVVVNNNMDGEEMQEESQGNSTFNHDYHPYFHAYKYPPSYIQGDQEHTSSGKRPYIGRNYNIVVNVNNFLEPGQFLNEDKEHSGKPSQAMYADKAATRKLEKVETLRPGDSDTAKSTSSDPTHQAHVEKAKTVQGKGKFEDARERLKEAAETLEKIAEDKAAKIRSNMHQVQRSVPEHPKDKIQFATRTTKLHEFTDRFHVILPKPLKTKKVSKWVNPRSLLGHRGKSEELSGDEASKDLSSYFNAFSNHRKTVKHGQSQGNIKRSTGSVTWHAPKPEGETDRRARHDLFSYFDHLAPHPKQHINTWLDDSHVLPSVDNRFHANEKRRVSKNYHYISIGAEGHNNAMHDINQYYNSLEDRQR